MWTNPKTNWVSTDYFNIKDYNRIKANLVYLSELANSLYLDISTSDMGADKVYEGDYYASEFNVFENNLEAIKNSTYSLDIGDKELFYDNGSFILWSELNRIESACLKYYNLLTTQLKNISKLPFTCGAKIGGMF